MRLGVVVERRVEVVHAGREADRAAGDAGSERGGVAQDVDLAIDVRADGGECLAAAKVVGEVDVGQTELVAERLVDLGEELALAQAHRWPRRGERIRQDVEHVDAVPAVHLDVLIKDARRDAQLRGRLEQERQTSPGALAAVGALALAEVRVDLGHEAGIARVVADEAHGRGVADRHIQRDLAALAARALIDIAAGELADGFALPERRRVADVAHRSRLRTGAEQRALRAAQHFDAVHVEEIDVRREQRERDH